MNRFFLVFISVLLQCLSLSVFASNNISCEVNHTLFHNSFIVKASYRIILVNGTGVILINGNATESNKPYIISREIRFTYSNKDANYYLFENNIIRKNPLDNISDSLMMKHYPSFFVKNNNSLIFYIQKENESDYIMSFVSAPFFYCNG